MPKAQWQGTTLAEAADKEVEIVEGNVYFPIDRVQLEYLLPSGHHSICSWKGTASYYHVVAGNGNVNHDAAWYYPQPKDAAHHIAGRIAFWKGVEILP